MHVQGAPENWHGVVLVDGEAGNHLQMKSRLASEALETERRMND
jgi:hypothetical protein